MAVYTSLDASVVTGLLVLVVIGLSLLGLLAGPEAGGQVETGSLTAGPPQPVARHPW